MRKSGTTWDFRPASIPDHYLIAGAVLLVFPALLIHLGLMTFIGDEGIRSGVALEMQLSGNYLVPKLNGQPYFNKPPLYNWVLLAASEVLGGFGEWPARLTTVFFLLVFAGTTFLFTRRYFDRVSSATMALMVVTSGRILLWDSMLGLIDIAFSWVVYLNFMLLYHFGQKKAWLRMFLWSYFLAAVAFLLKGLPAVVFQGLSVPMALYLHGDWRRRFFSVAHLAGIGLGLVIGLLYYAAYAREVSLETAFRVLLDQSMQRTATHHGLQKTLVHLFTFPTEQVYHFLPWSLLVIFFFHPGFWRRMQAHPFVRFNFFLLAANIPVYWISVEVYPRYLLMFIPMFNLTAWYIWRHAGRPWGLALRVLFGLVSTGAAVACMAMPLVERTHALPWLWPLWLAGSALLCYSAWGVWTDGGRMLLWVVVSMLALRIVFNLVVLPFRNEDDRARQSREDAYRLAEKWKDRRWYLYRWTETQQVARFYTTHALRQIVRRVEDPVDPEALYLVDTLQYPDFKGRTVDSLHIENGRVLALKVID